MPNEVGILSEEQIKQAFERVKAKEGDFAYPSDWIQAGAEVLMESLSVPSQIDFAKCRKCDSRESRLNLELLRISCETAKVDPTRAVISINYLVDLLKAVEKYLDRFDEVMIGAGKAKKEGLDTTGLVAKVQDLQGELHMYAILARSRIGGDSNAK